MTLEERDERMREEGREEGRMETLVSLVCKQLSKGKTPQEIAEILDMDLSVIQKICDTAADFASEYPIDDIMAALEEKEWI
ncbi:MAG: hypothetical protein IJX90_03955 [Blautia sp.]|nr:hypothetical protein [Blautia sp.]